MSDEKWFHASISRQKAEELLLNVGIDGSFVVRSSESIPGAFALSVLYVFSWFVYFSIWGGVENVFVKIALFVLKFFCENIF